jgi:hypothetical protein
MSLRMALSTSALAAAVAPLASPGAPMGGSSDTGGIAGAAGTKRPQPGAGVAGSGGEAGAPPVVVPHSPLVLFTVGPGARGLAGSAVAGQLNPQSAIHASTTTRFTHSRSPPRNGAFLPRQSSTPHGSARSQMIAVARDVPSAAELSELHARPRDA